MFICVPSPPFGMPHSIISGVWPACATLVSAAKLSTPLRAPHAGTSRTVGLFAVVLLWKKMGINKGESMKYWYSREHGSRSVQ